LAIPFRTGANIVIQKIYAYLHGPRHKKKRSKCRKREDSVSVRTVTSGYLTKKGFHAENGYVSVAVRG